VLGWPRELRCDEEDEEDEFRGFPFGCTGDSAALAAVAIFLTTTHPHYHHTSKTGTPEPPQIENFLKQPPQIHTKNPGAIYPNPPNKENHHTTKSKPPHIHTTTTHPIPGLQNHHTSTIFSKKIVSHIK
jgi:hypothetical protein